MRAEPALALGGVDDLPHGHAAGRLRERIDEPAVARPGSEPDPRIADPGCPDELVERQVMASANGSSSSRLGLRCPLSNRDSVLFEIPSRWPGPSASRHVAHAVAAGGDRPQPAHPGSATAPHDPTLPAIPRNGNETCVPPAD